MRRAAAALLVHAIIIFFAGAAHAATFTVGPEGVHATIQAAIDAALAEGGENEIQIQQGTYNESLSIGGALAGGTLLISGGWQDDFSDQVEDASLTNVSGEGSHRVLDIDSATGRVALQNLTIRDGFHGAQGAGIHADCSDCSLELLNVRLVENEVDDEGEEFSGEGGSALFASMGGSGILKLDDCLVADNRVRTRENSRGPLDIFLRDTVSATITRSEIEFNTTQAVTGSAGGGGLHLFAENQTSFAMSLSGVDHNTVDALDGQTAGAAVEITVWDMASFDIERTNFAENIANSRERGNTGTLFLSTRGEGQSRLFRNEICNNQSIGQGSTAGSGAAIWIRDDSRVVAEANRWINNTGPASSQLSLIAANQATLIFRDSVVANGGNVAIGVRGDSPDVSIHLTNLTVTGQPAILGPVIFNGVGDLTFHNSIVDGEDGLNLDGVDAGNNLIGVFPFFADPDDLDFLPLAGSPAIHAGDNDPPGGLGEFDADGADRVEGPAVDIGARELIRIGGISFLTQIGNGQFGDIILETAVEIANPSAERRAFGIDFFDSTGAPWPLELEGLGAVTSVAMALEPFQTWSARTSGTGNIASGYARLRTGDPVDATAVFTRKHAPTGAILYQAGVPTSQSVDDATLFVDTLGVLDTGVAIVNLTGLETLAAPGPAGSGPTGPSDQVSLNLYDPEFNLLDTTTIDLAPGEHVAKFVTELFPDNAQVAEMQGTLIAEGDLIALVTLRQNDDLVLDFPNEVPTLAAFPVLERSAPQNQEPAGRGSPDESSTFYFAQLGNGQAGAIGFQTSFSFANTGADSADLQVDFFDQGGAPLSLSLIGLGAGSSFPFQLESGQSLFLRTDGLGALQVGWARVTSTAREVDGSAVFSRFDVPSGILETESGVPSTRAFAGFAILVDTLGNSDTGIAIASVGNVPAGDDLTADIELDLYDAEGDLMASEILTQTLGKQTAMFVGQLFPEVPGVDEMRGLIVARRSGSRNPTMVPVTLKQNDDPLTSFPESVGTLTAFPVLGLDF